MAEMDIEKRARDLVRSARFVCPEDQHDPEQPYKSLIATAMREIAEQCALVCVEQIEVFLSPEYAAGQPLSSFQERFACSRCHNAIRRAAGLDGGEK